MIKNGWTQRTALTINIPGPQSAECVERPIRWVQARGRIGPYRRASWGNNAQPIPKCTYRVKTLLNQVHRPTTRSSGKWCNYLTYWKALVCSPEPYTCKHRGWMTTNICPVWWIQSSTASIATYRSWHLPNHGSTGNSAHTAYRLLIMYSNILLYILCTLLLFFFALLVRCYTEFCCLSTWNLCNGKVECNRMYFFLVENR